MTNACFSHIPTELHTTSAPSPQSVLDALHDAAPGAPALSVWATAQSSPAAQRAGRYVPESTAHPANMLPAVAAHAILHYTQPGDLVLDPMCGMGTTLVEAIHTGRRALGVEYERHWVGITRANLAHVGHHRLLAGFTRILAATRIFLRPGDLRDIDWDTAERVDVLTAGFPCQDISAAGKRAGIELAQRSGLWHDIVEAVRVLRPALLTVENVAVLRWRNGGLHAVLRDLATTGYDTCWRCVRCRRRRPALPRTPLPPLLAARRQPPRCSPLSLTAHASDRSRLSPR
nr:hypothetical protein GCM10020241_53840 [Streptoalloteichus tenebrarius]